MFGPNKACPWVSVLEGRGGVGATVMAGAKNPDLANGDELGALFVVTLANTGERER